MARRSKKPEFAVIGLGRFGSSLAHKLVERGYTVLGIDHNRELVQSLADELTQVIAMDSTDEDALRAIDITSFDVVVVAIGSDLESNLMTTLALKSMGTRKVICKAQNSRQRTALLAVGADQVVLPEQEAAYRLAYSMTVPLLIDQISLGDRFSIIELKVPPQYVGRTLRQLELRQRFGVTVIAIEHSGELILSPPADYVFAEGDCLAIVGANDIVEDLVAS